MKKSILRIFAIALTTLLLVCAMAFSVSAEDATAPAVSIDKFNLVFEDNVYLKYAVKYDGVNDESISSENIGMLFFSTSNGDYTAGNENFSSSVVGFVTIEGQKYYTFEYRYITAKQMTEYVYSVAYIDVDGVKYYSAPNKFSVLEYCYSKLGKTGEASTNEDYRNLLTATLEQGAMAQKYFKYNTDRLANADYYQVKLENGTLFDGTTSGLYLSGDKVVLTAPETDSKGHVFSRWENSKGSKIGTTAVYELTVGTENEIYTPIYEHNVVIDVAVEPTCTATGLTEGKHCSVCSAVLLEQELIPATGHTEVIDRAVEPTCGETGLTEGSHCLVCNEIFVAQEVILANGHTEVIDEAVEPTCTTTGLTEGKRCSMCNEIFVAQEVIPVNGHIEVIDEAVVPTCAQAGLTEGSHCLTCGEILVAQADIPVLETHTYENSNECSVCGYIDVQYFEFTLLSNDTYSLIVKDTNNIPAQVLIPSIYDGKLVSAIGDNAFYLCSNLMTVVIPDSVTRIEALAFYYCKSLLSVVIPDSVTVIGRAAFAYCSSLTSVVLSNSITNIDTQMFYYCSSLTSVVIPDSVTRIGEWSFEGCIELTSVVIPKSVTAIGQGAFSQCTGLTSVYYKGTASDWSKKIWMGASNTNLTAATRYYYSPNAPTTTNSYISYWYYDENNDIVIW